MVTSEGHVKILDFGLARIVEPETNDLSVSPTLTARATQAGVILGTAAYMSPEQAKGRVADKRSDVWAFGCVLFELLSGRRAFDGEDVSDTLANILKTEPDWTLLPADVPGTLRRVLSHCLDKDRRARIPEVAAVRFLLDDALQAPAVQTPAAAARGHRAWMFGSIAFGLVGIALGAALVIAVRSGGEPPQATDLVQFPVAPPDGMFVNGPPRLSPNGRLVVFPAQRTSGGANTLYLRPLSSGSLRSLAENVNPTAVFWSPDSRFVAFVADGKLKKIGIDGSPPVVLCDVTTVSGGTWSESGIVLGSVDGPLRFVSADGGTPKVITALKDGSTSYRWPSFLPDGKHVLYFARHGSEGRLEAVDLDSASITDLGQARTTAEYGSGRLLYIEARRLMARPFDPHSLRFTGDPLPVAEGVASGAGPAVFGAVGFSVVESGRLAYWAQGAPELSRLTWLDRHGKALGTIGDPAVYTNVAISRDGRQAAASLGTGNPMNLDIWLFDLTREGTARRLTFDPAVDADPAFSPDGTQVVFNSLRTSTWNLYQHSADGSGQDVLLVPPDRTISSPDWSRDGRYIIYTASGDLWVLPMFGDRKPYPLLQTPFTERAPAFSPDGQWVAYESNASGRLEVYVRPFAPGGGEYKVSRDGGWSARWRGDGRELLFLAPDGTMMAASIETVHGIVAGVPEPLFRTSTTVTQNQHPWAMTQDGQRFLIDIAEKRPVGEPITIVMNWLSLLSQKAEGPDR
jgi:Tol biopolymer transport system component